MDGRRNGVFGDENKQAHNRSFKKHVWSSSFTSIVVENNDQVMAIRYGPVHGKGKG